MAASKAPKRRPPRVVVFRRWLAVGVVGLVAFLYYRPLTHYLDARRDVARADAQVQTLEAERSLLEHRLAAQKSTEALIREARSLAYVKPGERLFIVKGIPEWREARRGRIEADE